MTDHELAADDVANLDRNERVQQLRTEARELLESCAIDVELEGTVPALATMVNEIAVKCSAAISGMPYVTPAQVTAARVLLACRMLEPAAAEPADEGQRTPDPEQGS